MGLFNRKKKVSTPVVVQPPATSRVEVELEKDATNEAVAKAKETNKHLNDLLVENGFTLKIYLAAGGKVQHKRGGN